MRRYLVLLPASILGVAGMVRADFSMAWVLSIFVGLSSIAGGIWALPRLWTAANWTARAIVAMDAFGKSLPQILELNTTVQRMEKRVAALENRAGIGPMLPLDAKVAT